MSYRSDSLEVSITPDSVIRPDGADQMVTVAPQTIGQSGTLQLDNDRKISPNTSPNGHHPLADGYKSETDNLLTAVVKEQSSRGTSESRSPFSDWDSPDSRPAMAATSSQNVSGATKKAMDRTDPTKHAAAVHNLGGSGVGSTNNNAQNVLRNKIGDPSNGNLAGHVGGMTSTQMLVTSLNKAQQVTGRPRFWQTGAVSFQFAFQKFCFDTLFVRILRV